MVSEVQFNKIQRLIQAGIDEGAELVTGGPGRPENLNRGYFVRPTVFANVRNDMTIAREEIFGPVLSILPYKDEAEAIELANDTVYGLAAYVQSGRSGPCPQGRRRDARRQRLHELPGRATPPRRSAATSSPATAANTANGRSTISSRSRP